MHYALLGWDGTLYVNGAVRCTVRYWDVVMHYTFLVWDDARYLIGFGCCTVPYWGGVVHYALLGRGGALYLIGVGWCTIRYWGGMLHDTLLGWDGALWSVLPALGQVGDSLYSPWPGLLSFVGMKRVVLVVASAEEHDQIQQVHGQITSL